MSGGLFIAAAIAVLAIAGLTGFIFFGYRKVLRRAKGIERGLKMVPLLIHLPPITADPQANRDAREVMREKIAQAESLYDLIAGTATKGFKSHFYGQRHIAFELVAAGGRIHYYAAVPVALVSIVEQAVLTAYPGAQLEETEDYNIFNPEGKIAGTSGGEMVLKQTAVYPIATYDVLERDPMEAIINALATLQPGEGAAVQIMLRPAGRQWVKTATDLVKKKKAKGDTSLNITAMDLAKGAVKAPETAKPGETKQLSGLDQALVDAVEAKTKHPAYEVLIRIMTSASTLARSQAMLKDLANTFILFDSQGLNGFKFIPAGDVEGLVTAFIFRFFPPELNHDILNSRELATLFHLPESQVSATSQVERQASKQVDGPVAVSAGGLMLGFNEYRGQRKEIHLSPEDRRRHTYIVGQTGTGKSNLLEHLAVQDMQAGNGFAFIDPHGDTAEQLMAMVPKERTEDVIYFNPADTDYPLGLNIFEFQSPEQKDFLIQEAIGMLYKLYDPGHTGIIGPRYEHWFRNAALTLMSDPAGSTFIEVPKVFTDAEYLKTKFKHVTDPTVIDFWTKEMAQTSDYHKSEMLGWFVSKFGAFQSNEMMRNIIGQTKSSFNLREIMDNKKILIVNLSKGRVGELNSQLLGMIFVIKFQAAAMSRASMAEAERSDFSLYVDEFQNFSTDSFASILSEARKYRLNLIVANQFIGQLSNEIRDAVFGNVGSVVSFRTGPEDADFLVKQFAPVFDAHDLVNLEIGHAAVRLLINGLPSQPFSMTTLPPLQHANPELGLAVKQLSAAKFGTPRATVEAAIFKQLGPVVPAAAKPAESNAVPAPTAAAVPVPSTPVPAAAPDLSRVINSDAPLAQAAPPPPEPVVAPAPVVVSPASAPSPPAASPAASEASLAISDIVKDMLPQPVPTGSALPPLTNPAAAPSPAPVAPPPATPAVVTPPVAPSNSTIPTVTKPPVSGPTPVSKQEVEIESEIKSAGLGNVITIVEPIRDAAPKPKPLPPLPANVTPPAVQQVQQPPALPKIVQEAQKDSTPPSQPLRPGQTFAPVPPSQPAIVPPAAPAATLPPVPAIKTPAMVGAGTKPILSGQKPTPANGEVFVDEHGNVHISGQ